MTAKTIKTNTGETLTLRKTGKAQIFGCGFGGCERIAYRADEDGSWWYRRYGQWNEAEVERGGLHESCRTRCGHEQN